MDRTKSILLGAALVLGLAAPASADYVRLGSVDVGFHGDNDVAYSRFGGPVEGLKLVASRSDIYCSSIAVRFEAGDTQTVFSGRLDERSPVYVDLRGNGRRIHHIRFICRSNEWSGGKIYITAEVGRYRDYWRRDRDWDHYWSGLLGGGPGPGPVPGPGPGPGYDGGGGWVSMGVVSFEGSNDSEAPVTGWAGAGSKRLGLRPLDSDARCTRVHVSFMDGSAADVDYNTSPIPRGGVRVLDLPGYRRNVKQVYLRCHALGQYRTRVEILVKK